MTKPDLNFINKFNCELFESHSSKNMSQHHYHDAYEILLLVDGKRYMAFNGVRQLLERGTLFIAQPFVPHGSESHETIYYKRYTLNFSNEDLKQFFSQEEIDAVICHLSTGVYHITEEQTEAIQRYMERITEYRSRYTDLGRKMVIMELFLALDYINSLAGSMQLSTGETSSENTGMHPAVSQAMNYVKNHFDTDIDLDFMAEHVHLSKSQFCRVFQTTTGTSFMQYLNSYRLSKAHMLISHTRKSLHAIAAETGFYSTEHMTRTFQKTYHMSPSQWRRTYMSAQ